MTERVAPDAGSTVHQTRVVAGSPGTTAIWPASTASTSPGAAPDGRLAGFAGSITVSGRSIASLVPIVVPGSLNTFWPRSAVSCVSSAVSSAPYQTCRAAASEGVTVASVTYETPSVMRSASSHIVPSADGPPALTNTRG